MTQNPRNTEASIARVLKYTGLFGGIQGLYVLIGIVRNKLTSILLSTGGIGLIDMYNRTAELIGNSTNMGISFSAVQHIAELNDRGGENSDPRSNAPLVHYIRLVRSWIAIAALLGCLVTLLLSPFWAWLSLGSVRNTTMVIALSPLIMLLTLAGGELAILRGLRQLKTIALITALGGISTLCITIPIYWWMGTPGIVPALVISTGVLFLMQLYAAHRIIPYRITLTSWKFLRRGSKMIQLGFSYILTGIVCSGCELLVRAYILNAGSMGDVGLYAAGFTLTVTYTRLIFTSMDSDYYPRLSAAAGQVERLNVAVNRQIDVLALLMAPLLIIFCLALPLIVRILYTDEFVEAIPMVYAAASYMYFKAVGAPIAYLSLAHSRSRLYLMVESSYSIIFLLTATVGFSIYGIVGAGLGLSISNAAYFFIIWFVYGREFGFRFDRSTFVRCLWQFGFLVIGLSACAFSDPLLHFGIGGLAFLLSFAFSMHLFRKEVAVPERFKRWLFKK